MFKNFIRWWNTLSENLMTNGHNVIVAFCVVIPILLVTFLVIFKLFGIFIFSWWYVFSPLLLIIIAPFLIKLTPTGREIFDQEFSDREGKTTE